MSIIYLVFFFSAFERFVKTNERVKKFKEIRKVTDKSLSKHNTKYGNNKDLLKEVATNRLSKDLNSSEVLIEMKLILLKSNQNTITDLH